MIFQWDQSRAPTETIIAGYWGSLSKDEDGTAPEPDSFANELLEGVVERIDAIDALITKFAQNWRLERMSTVDRCILRLGVGEMMSQPSLGPVVIDEALEIGRRYSEDSGPFLNGILDAVRRSLTEDAPAPVAPAG
jgi:N utilization substance protein B